MTTPSISDITVPDTREAGPVLDALAAQAQGEGKLGLAASYQLCVRLLADVAAELTRNPLVYTTTTTDEDED